MKALLKHVPTAAIMLFASQFVFAAELKLSLPEGEWLLGPTSPPQLEKEGQFSPLEQSTLQQVSGFLTLQEYDQVLEQLHFTLADATTNLEQGNVYSPTGTLIFNGSSAAMFFLLGHTYMAVEQYDAAEAAFKSALVMIPDYIRVNESLGFLLLQVGRYEDARPYLVKAAGMGLVTPRLFAALGYLNQETNNFWGAASAYQQAMMLEPDNSRHKTGLLFALNETNQYDSGLTLVEQMLQENPDDPELWLFRANMSQMADNQAKALSSLETAIRLGANESNQLQVAARMHMQNGSIERSVELMQQSSAEGLDFQYFDQALEWFSRNNEWNALESMLEYTSAFDGDLNSAQQSNILTRKASLNQHNDNTDTARSQLLEAIDLDGANGGALLALAHIYRDDQNNQNADIYYQRASAIERYRENALISQAQLAIDQDEFEKALRILRTVMSENPSRVELRRNIEILESMAENL